MHHGENRGGTFAQMFAQIASVITDLKVDCALIFAFGLENYRITLLPQVPAYLILL